MLIQQLSQLSEKENRVQTARLLISGATDREMMPQNDEACHQK
jgi:hypothetical protein